MKIVLRVAGRYLLLLGFSGSRKGQDCSHGRTML
jgi:hypothetical protein